MPGGDPRQYAFPRIKRVRLHSFSLYSLRPDASVAFPGGVLCLAGANGIGKSTFLATLNYGLTGAVPHPRRRLLSTHTYLRDATEYSGDYFAGRISEGDRANAAVTVEFEISGAQYSVTRGLFDANDVRIFEVDGVDTGGHVVTTALQRAGIYRDTLTHAVGLTSFEQYVFLQHFIFTFDEARHLLFWDESATAQALFLCFGGDPAQAAQADILTSEADKAWSRGRNAQYQANNVRKRIEVLQQSLGEPVDLPETLQDLDAQYEALERELLRTTERAEFTRNLHAEGETKVAQSSASVASLRAAYADIFNRLVNGHSAAKQHPLVLRAAREAVCGICETSGPDVASTVQSRVDDDICPLCGSPISEGAGDDEELKEELSRIDRQLVGAKAVLDEAAIAEARLRRESDDARARATDARAAFDAFKNKYQEAVEVLEGHRAARTGPVAQTLDALRRAMAEFLAVRDNEYAQRDRIRDQLRSLQRELELSYARAEQEFVPRFRELAELFLGIDLDVLLQLTAPAGMKLIVELRGSARHDQNQMSESQRFFVDIALRMALAQQMSSDSSRVPLLIDTPEGSLDIAYEDRAGEMFSSFASRGHDILMTANINSSKLLTTLARRCGTRGMTLNAMTGWTELSDVQQAATEMFQEALQEINAALGDGPATEAASA